MKTFIEYRVRPVTRYIVTRFERQESEDGSLRGVHGSSQKGEFDGFETAYAVGYALAAAEHERLGWPIGDERIQYPRDERPGSEAPTAAVEAGPTDEQIKHMVSRFLGWRLPESFSPDCGISFKAEFNEHTPWPMKHDPMGTNLFDATQAEAMVRYMVEGMPA